MGYIESGTRDGAKLHLGGGRVGGEGFFIEPTIFVDAKPEMKIVREEIFGPVGVVAKFENEEGERTVNNNCHLVLKDSYTPSRCDPSGKRHL